MEKYFSASMAEIQLTQMMTGEGVADNSLGFPDVVPSALLWFVISLVFTSLTSIVVFKFRQHNTHENATSLTRPILAVLLVGTLVTIAVASLISSNADLQKTLIGPIVSLASAAAGFYFASANATDARRDMMNAATAHAWTVAPNLAGKTLEQAQSLIARTDFTLKVNMAAAHPTSIIQSQTPSPGERVAPWQEFQIS
jgi:heme/copper-type cytochrome/quinol oxidase subunit 2